MVCAPAFNPDSRSYKRQQEEWEASQGTATNWGLAAPANSWSAASRATAGSLSAEGVAETKDLAAQGMPADAILRFAEAPAAAWKTKGLEATVVEQSAGGSFRLKLAERRPG